MFAYTVLRAIPRKLGGVLGLAGAVVVIILPCFSTGRWLVSCQSDPMRKILTWQFFSSFFLLTLLGGQPAEDPFVGVGQLSACVYFLRLFILASPDLGWRSYVIV